MHRATLTLLASAGSLAIMVLIANPADAAPVVAPNIDSVMEAPAVQIVKKHRTNPMLNLVAQQSNPILDQMGCNCTACIKALRQMQGQFTL
ncbi:hypothetical protein [Allocoleopsis franciscana]|uniref:Uncharacterized protein n=1 Tax=Allocoleopsis franciscana PCC 7113 TaxID=1173027 RepID=K9WH74_9CYAN|nr:hypothetical protein [Allocoleopsis franciscana]AFZ18882.1 hypothetical protein Mic7113_3139 [Allocoleopsis franciscana PCC 7113]